MKTKPSPLAPPALAAAASLLFAVPATTLAQDAAAEADQAAMMEAYMKLITPGPQHEQLAKLAGEWEATQTLWMAPGAPAVEAKATAKFRMIMGGRFLVQTYKSEIPGMGVFTGRGTTGYDNAAKEYVQTWLDSFNTGIMTSRGKEADDKTIELVGESPDPFTKQKVKFRTLSKYIDDDHHEMEMFETRPGMEERKIMKIVYKRTAGPAAKSGKAGAKGKAKAETKAEN